MKKTHDPSKAVAAAIKDCCDDLGVEPTDLFWNDFQKWVKTSEDYSVADIQRAVSRVGGYNAVRDAAFPPKATDRAQVKKRVQDEARANRREAKEVTNLELFAAQLRDSVARLVTRKITVPRHVNRAKSQTKRVLVLAISDSHFGADVKGNETGRTDYGAVEEARCLAKVVAEAADYKPQYRAETELLMLWLGDMIEGILHDPRSHANMAEQFARAVNNLCRAALYLSGAFGKVTIKCVPGNHDRDKRRHQQRAADQKWDGYATMVYFAVKQALAHIPNVQVDIPLTPYLTAKVFGHNIFGTHGDNVLDVGSIWTTVNTRKIEQEVDRLNASLSDGDRCDVFLVGHVHVPVMVTMPNGCTLFTNSTLKNIDSYGVSNGRLSVRNRGQWLFESVAEHAVGDMRLLRVDESTERDSSLDKIIQPWTGF